MLASLRIDNVVLIESLLIEWSDGMTALTGETGAGKSILLDSLSLALGARADRALVRAGAERGQVTASFDLSPEHPAFKLLTDGGMEPQDDMILRRQITTDGRSKAWINDIPVSQTLLSQVGAALVEIHGQHDDRGLLQAAAHRDLLDAYGGLEKDVAHVRACHAAYEAVQGERARLAEDIAASKAEQAYLEHAGEELAALAPVAGEETALADQRAAMMQGERLSQTVRDIRDSLYRDAGLDADIRGLARRMERQTSEAATLFEPVVAALDRAALELEEAGVQFEHIEERLAFDPAALEEAEPRLFELRRLARKHDCMADDLAAIAQQIKEKLNTLHSGEDRLAVLDTDVQAARDDFEAAVEGLSIKRKAVAERLDASVMVELPPLKLDAATFRTRLNARDPAAWDASGAEEVQFEIQTNPGSAFGPLVKVASGGELARFILALKVVLAGTRSAPTLVFDEVDRGIGGATAAAVGARLTRLAATAQLLLVTHSPQVAGLADQQYKIEKYSLSGETRTGLQRLGDLDRVEEIARMLAGAEITEAARGAARDLMQQAS